MTNPTYYSKRTIGSFFIGVFLAASLLYVIDYLLDAKILNQTQQKEFVEVITTAVEDVKEIVQVVSLPTVVVDEESIEQIPAQYIEVTDGCGVHFGETECLNVRSGPSKEFPVVMQLRNGIVLKVDGLIENEEGRWYKIIFDEWLRYPNRVSDNWYVSADHVRVFTDAGIKESNGNEVDTTTKKIIIDRFEQSLTAYNGDDIFLQTAISTGLDLSPTPRGTFTVFRKTPSRYMQGPLPNIPGSDYYDLPGVPWNLYFTEQGAVIHGAYWHDSFGIKYSHGCVNLPVATAEELYHWADVGTVVVVRD